MQYKYLKHTADVKFHAFGKTLDEAFANSAIAMFDVITDTKKVKALSTEEINVESDDKESLLYDFLEEILFIFDTKGFVINNVKVKIDGKKLNAKLTGDTLLDQYEIEGDVKAVTYNDMKISEKDGKYVVQVVVDI